MTAQTSNLSCLLYGPHDARFEDRQVPVISDPYDVIIKIAYVGVCGSDVGLPSVYLKRRRHEHPN
jgi:D-xylulose reductase